jgi:hypothetical protein
MLKDSIVVSTAKKQGYSQFRRQQPKLNKNKLSNIVKTEKECQPFEVNPLSFSSKPIK